MVEDSNLPASQAIVTISGGVVKRIDWDRVRPKEHAIVRVTAVPRGGGGGKNIFRTILTLAVIVGAAFAGPAIAGALGLAGLGIVFTGVVSAVGLFAVNALIPASGPNVSQLTGQGDDRIAQSPNYFIQGARNQARLGQVVPVNFGRNRVVPPYGAPPFSVSLGDTNRFFQLFVFASGVNTLSSFRIGTTNLDNFEDVRTSVNQGTNLNPLNRYPNQVSEQGLQIQVTASGGPVVRTIPAKGDRIGIDMSFPQLVFVDDIGNFIVNTVRVRPRFRKVGQTGWTLIPEEFDSSFPAAWLEGGVIEFRGATRQQHSWGLSWAVPENDNYEIEVTRLTIDAEDRIEDSDRYFDESFWTAIRSFVDADPLAYPLPLAKIALSLRGQGQLSGVVDRFSCIGFSRLRDWDTATQQFIFRETNNPAACLLAALGHQENPNALPDSRIDLTSIQEFSEWCEENNFDFNEYQETNIDFETLIDGIAASGRAYKSLIDGKVGVSIERPQEFPVTTISPRNSINFSFEKTFMDIPHAFRVRFRDQTNDFQQNTVTIYRTGFDETNATNIETRDYLGVTKAAQIRRLAIFDFNRLLTSQLRYTVQVDWEALPLTRGDRVILQHDTIAAGLGAGRIESVTTVANEITEIVVDTPLDMVLGETYSIVIRVPTIDTEQRHFFLAVDTVEGLQTTLTLTTPLDITGVVRPPQANDLAVYATPAEDTLDAQILEIEMLEDEQARLALVPYDETIYDVEIVDPNPDTTILDAIFLPNPEIVEIRTDETVLAVDVARQSVSERAVIFVKEFTGFGGNAALDAQRTLSQIPNAWEAAPIAERTNNSISISGVRCQEYWDFRVRWVAPDRLPGPWVERNNVFIVGRSTVPDALQNVRILQVGETANIAWDEPPELDVQFGGRVLVRHSNSTIATFSETVSVGSTMALNRSIALPSLSGIFYLTVQDSAGLRSPSVSILSSQASLFDFAAPVTSIQQPTFPGVKSGTVVVLSGLQLDSDGAFDDIVDFDLVSNLDTFGGTLVSGTYVFDAPIDLGSVKTVRVTAVMESFSFTTGSTVDSRAGNVDDWADWDDSPVNETDGILSIRLTDDDPSASPTWGPYEPVTSRIVTARGIEAMLVIDSSSSTFNRRFTRLELVAEEVV